MAREIDPENLSREDVVYIKDRPWMVQEFEMQGYDLPELDSFEDEDLDDEDSDEPDEDEVVDYSSWTNQRLKDEINARNEGREEDEQIVPEGSNKPELVAALVADDVTEDEDED